MAYSKQKGVKFYEDQELITEEREENMREILDVFVKATDEYGKIISRITLMLGHIAPASDYDIAQRDLMADVFDNLYEARSIILRGKYVVAYPVARRAFESLTLKIAFYLEPKMCDRWLKGKQIGNVQVREALERHKGRGGEPIDETRRLYAYFSNDSHPNYFFIPQRSLGQGNHYVLGSIGQPLLYTICILCRNILQLWHWFTVFQGFYCMEHFDDFDRELRADCKTTIEQGRAANDWLNQAIKDLYEELESDKKK